MSHLFEGVNKFVPKHPPLPWKWLTMPTCDLHQQLILEWEKLVMDSSKRETTLTNFVATHASMLFPRGGNIHFAINELRLGADHRVDFVLPRDQWSNGMTYTLVEFERPCDAPFTAKGDVSARLSHALDQINNWRRWIEDNRAEARRMFPCSINHRRPSVSYALVIGNRENTRPWLEKRNDLAARLGIEIRSFDWLTDNLKEACHWLSNLVNFGAAQERELTLHLRNAFTSPFLCAFSDTEWRAVMREAWLGTHFTINNVDVMLKHRRSNKGLAQFRKFCRSHKEAYSRWLTYIKWDSPGDYMRID